MTEEQPYEVISAYEGFELRRYPEHVLAEVEIDGTFETAGSAAFRSLVSYIGGGNATGVGLAMTAPVIQQRQHGETLNTTEIASGRFVVAFVLPASTTAATAPLPRDPAVQVRVVPTEYAAAARFSGRWTASSYGQHVSQLVESVRSAGLEIVGSPRFARFDPPWTPWFMRRNEVVVSVRDPSGL
ncbi:MAG: heme-binding protein [Actinomycetes bacterium]